MAANTNPPPSELSSQGPSNESEATGPAQPTSTAIPTPTYLTTREVRELMLEIDVPSQIMLYQNGNARSKASRVPGFQKMHQRLVSQYYPQLESTTKKLNTIFSRFHDAVMADKKADKNLIQSVARLATLMGVGATTTTSVAVGSPILQDTLAKIVTLSHDGLGPFDVSTNLDNLIEHANTFTQVLNPIMEVKVTEAGKALTPQHRVLRSMRDDTSSFKVLYANALPANPLRRLQNLIQRHAEPMDYLLDEMSCEDKLIHMLGRDIKTVAHCASRHAAVRNVVAWELSEAIVQTWNSQRNLRSVNWPCDCSFCRDGRQNLPVDTATFRAPTSMAASAGTSAQPMSYTAPSDAFTSPQALGFDASARYVMPQMESTAMAWDSASDAFTSDAFTSPQALGFDAYTSNYLANAIPQHGVPDATYPPTGSYVMPQMEYATAALQSRQDEEGDLDPNLGLYWSDERTRHGWWE